MIFSLRQIPALQHLSPLKRVEVIQAAAQRMPFKRKALSNILKTLILVALFWSLLYVNGWLWKIVGLLAVGLFYPLLLMPIQIHAALPYIEEVLQENKLQQE